MRDGGRGLPAGSDSRVRDTLVSMSRYGYLHGGTNPG